MGEGTRVDRPRRAAAASGPTIVAAVAGVLAAAVALAIAEPIAALVRPAAAPLLAVGSSAIDLTPAWLKEFAIRTFGVHDKLALIIGMGLVVTALAGGVGLLARRDLRWGIGAMAGFGLVGVIAAITRPDARPADVLPSLLGAAAGIAALAFLSRSAIRAFPPAPRTPVAAQPGAGTAPLARTAADDEAAEGSALDHQVGHTAPEERAPEDRAADGDAADSDDVPADDVPADDVPADGTPGEDRAAEDEPASGPAASSPGSSGPAEPALGRTSPGAPGPERRAFLLAGAGAVAVAGASAALGRALLTRGEVKAARKAVAVRLPSPARPAGALPRGADLRIPGLAPFVTPNADFYRIDTALTAPQIDPAHWKLRVHGMVDRPIEITFDDLLRRPLIEHDVTLTCVSNEVGGDLIGNARWLGASLAQILREAGVKAGADQILSRSSDGWTCGTPVDTVMDGRDALLAVAMNGAPLPVEHGFPARMVIPGLYGYVSATKWVVDLELTRFADSEAYWTTRGWAERAPIKTMARIDVPSAGRRTKAGRVPVAGVAWAQHRGISAVEVRIDKGQWRQAQLAPVPGTDTWRQWFLEWDARPGTHRIEVRATDSAGATQTSEQLPPPPDGATGWHSVTVKVE